MTHDSHELKLSRSEEGERKTDDSSTLRLLSGAFFAGIVEDEVEEDVESTQSAGDLSIPLQVDEEEFVHVLSRIGPNQLHFFVSFAEVATGDVGRVQGGAATEIGANEASWPVERGSRESMLSPASDTAGTGGG